MTLVMIEAMGQKGEGVGQHDGLRVFVAGALPGETVELLDGKLSSVIAASPARVAPFCAYFGTCGGCQIQHWADGPYRAWKRGLVEAALRYRGIETPVDEVVDAHGDGRRRATFHIRKIDGMVEAGFMAQKSHALTSIERCPILEPGLARAADIARAIGVHAGNSDALITKVDSGIDVAVKAERKLQAALLGKLSVVVKQFDIARLTLNGDVVVEARAPLIRMGKATVRLPANTFLQATRAGEETLSALVTEFLDGAKSVADLFCGAGPFALRLAERAKVFAADTDHAAVAALAEAARNTQGLKPIRSERRDLFSAPIVSGELKEFDAAVFDPPRAGAEAQAKQLAKSKLMRVVAGSCDPQSFARDADVLIRGGYRLVRVVPIDQFRHTPHVEIVGLFRR